jgi:hypothetical protein
MHRKSFFVSALVATALFALLNLAVLAAARNTIPRQIARNIERTPGLNCLALGGSLVQSGFDASVFDAGLFDAGHAGVIALNAGLGSSYPVEHLLLLRHGFQKRSGLTCAMYGFCDLQLMEPPRTSLHELIGNRAMLYYFEPAVAASYYGWPLGDRLTFHLTRLFPAIEERGIIWAKLEKFRRRLGALGLPAQETNQFGRVQDFALMEPPSVERFARECEQAVEARRDLSRPILDMIRLSREHGARMTMIEMPMSASHVERYYRTPAWQHYRSYLQNLLASHGADYVNASDWVQDDRLFADHLHLSPQGSVVFSQKLAAAALSTTGMFNPPQSQVVARP